MRNEDTGEPIQCPHCKSQDDCPHLLAVIDLSFSECRGGYAYSRFDELHSTIEQAFTKRLQLTNTSPSKWEDDRLQELWERVTEEYERTKEVSIDGYILLLLLIELLKSAGSEEYMGPIDDEGGPGFSSAIKFLYAANPQSVLDLALSNLRVLLDKPLVET